MPGQSLLPTQSALVYPPAHVKRAFVDAHEDCKTHAASTAKVEQSTCTRVEKDKAHAASTAMVKSRSVRRNVTSDTTPNPLDGYQAIYKDACTQATTMEKTVTYIAHNSPDTEPRDQQAWICLGEDLPEMCMFAVRHQVGIHKKAWLTLRDIKRHHIFKDVRTLEKPAPVWIHFGPENRALNDKTHFHFMHQVRDLLSIQKARNGYYTFESEEQDWQSILDTLGDDVRQVLSCNFQDEYCNRYVFIGSDPVPSLDCVCGKIGTRPPITREDKSNVYQTICDYWFTHAAPTAKVINT